MRQLHERLEAILEQAGIYMDFYLRNLLAVAVLGAAHAAQALTLHAGDVTFNADFTGANPPPTSRRR